MELVEANASSSFETKPIQYKPAELSQLQNISDTEIKALWLLCDSWQFQPLQSVKAYEFNKFETKLCLQGLKKAMRQQCL